MTEPTPRGRFVWFDLMTIDPDATHAFYSAVMGWSTTEWKGPAAYTMWTVGGEPIGGVTDLPTDVSSSPHWLAYIASMNVDETVRQAEALGARVIKGPYEIPTVGRFAVVADPQGALFAVFTPVGNAPGHEGEARVGEFSWHELATHDYPAAYRFYERLFGWKKTSLMDMGAGGEYQMFGRNGIVLGGMFNRPAHMGSTPAWLHYVLVDDVHRAVKAVAAHGGKVVSGPMEVPGGDWIAQCIDPQGAMFAVHARKTK
jgi:predicted enzyme related to lactoylglutathione lyase